jgi:endonuclease III
MAVGRRIPRGSAPAAPRSPRRGTRPSRPRGAGSGGGTTPNHDAAAPADRAQIINAVLLQHYGEPEPRNAVDPLSELIAVVLSQHTSDVNSERAFDGLRARFPDWESVRRAPVAEVADAIRSGGLAVIKAIRIQRILNQILEARGGLSLDFLRGLPLEEARAFLRGLDGVGPKSAACVLLFSLNQPAMPVDTHIHRVAGRLGLIPARLSADAAHGPLERMVPPEDVYRFHVGLIRHGRAICKAQRPRCRECPLNMLCPYPAKTV